MKTTLRAFVPRMCILLGVASSGCAQVLGIDGWTEGGAGGQGGEQSTSSGPSGSMTSSVGTGSGGAPSVTATAASTGSGNCTPKDAPCTDQNECCSQLCEGGLCKGCVAVGQSCTPDTCCPSFVCGPDAKCCLPEGKPCGSPDGCCSQACVGGICAPLCTGEGEACVDGSECCPPLGCQGNMCVSTCGSQGHSCTLPSDCCAGLSCIGGTCISTCTPEWQSCSTNADCCTGLSCPEGMCVIHKPDQMESEANNSQATADEVYFGKVCGTIGPAGDHDWFAINLPGGVQLDATVVAGTDLCGPVGSIDSELEIRNATTQLAFNDDINTTTNFCSTGFALINGAGTYYVRVSASQMFAPMSVFSYCVTLTVFN